MKDGESGKNADSSQDILVRGSLADKPLAGSDLQSRLLSVIPQIMPGNLEVQGTQNLR